MKNTLDFMDCTESYIHFYSRLDSIRELAQTSLLKTHTCRYTFSLVSALFIDLGITSHAQLVCPLPAELNQVTACYINGDRTQSASEAAVVLFNHTTARGNSGSKEVVATIGEVGAVWGVAWRAQTHKLYASAFIKRHCDLSPHGTGAIYEIDLTTPTSAGAGTPTLWLDINSVTHLGAGSTLFPNETAANRELGAPTSPNRDAWAFNLVGRQGIGDIDISADGSTMYVVDLTNRQVLVIDMTTKTVTTRHPVPAPANYANADDRRPFGVKHHNGELYLGVVSSGETGEMKNNLRGTVMKLTAGVFTPLVDLPNWTYRDWPNGTIVGWYPYFTAHKNSFTTGYAYNQYPVPLISDIEFDANNNMIIGVMDWSCHRYGDFNYRPDTSSTDLYSFQAHGDLIRATSSGSTWTVESPVGEFFNDMQALINLDPNFPKDTFMGGLIVSDCSGKGLVSANMQDPFNTNQGGVIWMNTSNGLMDTNPGGQSPTAAMTSRLLMYFGGPGAFGKANGLGDMAITYAAAIPCAITDLAMTGGTSTCNDNGTPTVTNDDYFISNVTVTFANAPSTGNLVLSGTALHSTNTVTTVAVGSLGSTTSHTFIGVKLKANNTANALVATFSADTACTFTKNTTAVPPCSNPTCPTITVTPSPLSSGTVGMAYTASPTASGGTAPYTWTATSLPAGLSINTSTGAITGTPTAIGNATITATDANLCTSTTTLTVSGCPVYQAQTASTTVDCGLPVSKQLNATGGVDPYTWNVTTGNLPAGLTLSSAGLLSGTTTATGPVVVTITTRDSASCPGVVNLTINITPCACPVITVTPAQLPQGSVGTAYNQTPTVSGAPSGSTYTWSATGLPAGLTINTATGAVTGTPTAIGTAAITATYAGPGGLVCTGTATLPVVNNCCPQFIFSAP